MRFVGKIRPVFKRGSILEFFGKGPHLKGCWSLDGHTRDESGNANNGASTTSTDSWGKFHNSRYFRGAGYYDGISVGSSSTLKPTTELTLMAWVRPDGTGSSNSFIISKPCGVDPWYDYALIFGQTSVYFLLRTSAQTPCYTINENSAINGLGRYYLLTATYDGTSMRLFVNGVQVGSLAVTGTIQYYATGDYTNVIIGAYALNYAASSYLGRIEETAIFSRALNPLEISQYYRWASTEHKKYVFAAERIISYTGSIPITVTPSSLASIDRSYVGSVSINLTPMGTYSFYNETVIDLTVPLTCDISNPYMVSLEATLNCTFKNPRMGRRDYPLTCMIVDKTGYDNQVQYVTIGLGRNWQLRYDSTKEYTGRMPITIRPASTYSIEKIYTGSIPISIMPKSRNV